MDGLRKGAAELGIVVTDRQQMAFEQYAAMLQEWNRRTNLTAVDDAQGIRDRHFLDSLTCVTVTGDLSDVRLVDVGTGAGFPGIPLKILYPTMRLTLVESVGKKVKFLQTVVESLQLSDVVILNERAETVGQDPQHRQQYDWAVARAVAPLNILLELLLPLVKVGGHVLAMKGERAQRELEEASSVIATLGGSLAQMHPVRLGQQEQASFLVAIEKTQTTPARYPRRPGIPNKRPL